MSQTMQLLARLRHEGQALSRNRNFELFQQPAARRALKLHLHLQRLERDLLRFASRGRITLQAAPAEAGAGGRVVIEIVVPALAMRRQVYVSPDELQLLLEKPEIARILGGGGAGEGFG